VIRSTGYLMPFVFMIRIGFCYYPQLSNNTEIVKVMTAFVCLLSIFSEPKNRRRLITYYLVPKGIESLWNHMESLGYVKSFPGQELICMMSAFAALGYGYESDRDLIRGFIEPMLNVLWKWLITNYYRSNFVPANWTEILSFKPFFDTLGMERVQARQPCHQSIFKKLHLTDAAFLRFIIHVLSPFKLRCRQPRNDILLGRFQVFHCCLYLLIELHDLFF